MAKEKPKLRYDKSQRTIVAAPGSVERLRTAMRNAVEVLKEGHDAETAIGILEAELGWPARMAQASGFLSERDIAALCGGENARRRRAR